MRLGASRDRACAILGVSLAVLVPRSLVGAENLSASLGRGRGLESRLPG